MANSYEVEYTDTFCGEANYSWVRRGTVSVPELTHYGYDGGLGYTKANKASNREVVRKAKAEMGLTGVRGVTTYYGDTMEFRPYGMSTVMLITWIEPGS